MRLVVCEVVVGGRPVGSAGAACVSPDRLFPPVGGLVPGGDQGPGDGDGDRDGDDAEGEGDGELADGGLGEDEFDAGEGEEDREAVVEVGEAAQESGEAEVQAAQA